MQGAVEPEPICDPNKTAEGTFMSTRKVGEKFVEAVNTLKPSSRSKKHPKSDASNSTVSSCFSLLIYGLDLTHFSKCVGKWSTS